MGKVVDIDSKPRGKARRSKKPSKTALVLGGGGFTGGVYEIGTLRALDLLAVNSTVNNFDVYVGTSAGSFVAGMLANGVTPDEMMMVLNERVPSDLEDLDLNRVLKPNYLGFLSKAIGLPLRTLEPTVVVLLMGVSLLFLGAGELDPQIREGGDKGLPVSLAGQDSKLAKSFYEVAKKVAEKAKEIGAKSEDVLEIS